MKKEHSLIKNKGQVLLEALILLPLISTCFILCLLFFHVHAQHLWMDHQLYQSLICLSKGETRQHCKRKMEKKIKSFLWMGRLNNIQFKKGGNVWAGSFNWEGGFWKIRFRKRINLP
jgi:hypothetical protein